MSTDEEIVIQLDFVAAPVDRSRTGVITSKSHIREKRTERKRKQVQVAYGSML